MSPSLDPALGALAPSTPATPASGAPGRGAPVAPGGAPSFADVLHDAARAQPPAPTGDVRFSKHALERAQRRGIPLDHATLGRLSSGVGRIAAKGARDSLVLVDGTAFVVSVGNRTVITAVGAEQMREHVFTNIDSAVIA